MAPMANELLGPRYDGWGPDGGPPEGYDPGAATEPFPLGGAQQGGAKPKRNEAEPSGASLEAVGGALGAGTPAAITKPTRAIGYPREVPEKLAAGELSVPVSTGEGNELPHWTDPPTGEVPRALAGGGAPGATEDDMAAWRLLGSRGLRWRDDVNDWADEPSVADLMGDDAEYTSGAEGEGQYSFDEEFERLERQRQGPAAAFGGAQGSDDVTVSLPGPPLPSPGPVASSGEGASERTAGSATGVPPVRPRARPLRPTGLAADDEAAGAGQAAGPTPARHARARGTGAGEEGRRAGTAVLAGTAMVVVLAACYALGPVALLVLAALVVFGCVLEVLAMFQKAGFRPATLVAAVGSAGAVLATYWRGEPALPVVFALVVGASLVWYLARVTEARPVVNVAVTLLAFAWVGVLGSYAGLLLQAHDGKHLFLAAVAPAVAADVVAWFVGSRVGQHQLAPRTSPSKTWEGLAAGAFAALVAGVVIGKNLAPWGGLKHGLELGVVIAIVGPVGDLAQSMVKRDLHLKDSGRLLPGHGGLFDRFDSLLFALPATYYLAVVLHLV